MTSDAAKSVLRGFKVSIGGFREHWWQVWKRRRRSFTVNTPLKPYSREL